MRFSNRLAGHSKPDWTKVSIWISWLVFAWFFIGVPLVKNMQDPENPMNSKVYTYDFYRASVDTAFSLRDRAEKMGSAYRAQDYARDLNWLRTREHNVQHWITTAGSNPFDLCVDGLIYLAEKSEKDLLIARCQADGQSREMCERIASIAARDSIMFAVNEHGRVGGSPVTPEQWLYFGRHFLMSNIWAMLVTMLLLLLRLALNRKYSLRDELLLAPERFLWSCFWWGYGIANYPGNDLAGEIRFVKLRRQFLADKERWELTRHEEAALRLMARDRVIRFEEALTTVGNLGTTIVFQRRPLFTALLIWLTSGSFALRPSYATAADSVVVQKVVPATPADPLLVIGIKVRAEQKQFTPMGGDDFSSVGSPAMPSLINSAEPDIVCLGGSVLMDKRRRFRTIRTTESRAPPIIIDGGTR